MVAVAVGVLVGSGLSRSLGTLVAVLVGGMAVLVFVGGPAVLVDVGGAGVDVRVAGSDVGDSVTNMRGAAPADPAIAGSSAATSNISPAANSTIRVSAIRIITCSLDGRLSMGDVGAASPPHRCC
jgi:hypothetical protein